MSMIMSTFFIVFSFPGKTCQKSVKKSAQLQATPLCSGATCTCPKGYIYNVAKKMCDLHEVPVPSQGKLINYALDC